MVNKPLATPEPNIASLKSYYRVGRKAPKLKVFTCGTHPYLTKMLNQVSYCIDIGGVIKPGQRELNGSWKCRT